VGPVFALSLRQLAGRWRLSLVLLLTSLPAIMTVIIRLVEAEFPEEFQEVMLDGMFVSAIVPVVIMTLATSAFGNEVEDQTLSYLVLKPLRRPYIVLPKMMASVAVAGPLLVASGLVVVVVALEGSLAMSLAVGAGLAAGAVAYSAIFTWAGLVSSHALGFALVYVFLWEGVLARFATGLSYLSVRGYALAIMHGIDESGLSAFEDTAIEFPAAIGGAVVVTVGFLWLTVRRLQRMDVP
jgi:ABC-2 type transport system permease protein